MGIVSLLYPSNQASEANEKKTKKKEWKQKISLSL